MFIDERLASFISSLEVDKPEIIRTIEKQSIEDNVPIVKPDTQSLLRFLITLLKPLKILEVGTAVGFSSIFMSEYMPKEGKIVTIEKMPERIEKALDNFKVADCEKRIKLIEGDAIEILKDLEDKFDFIFMDAAKGQYINFLPEIMRLLGKNGILVSDNVLQDGDVIESRYGITRRNRTIHSRMREYLWTLKHHEELETVILPIGDGVTLSTRKSCGI